MESIFKNKSVVVAIIVIVVAIILIVILTSNLAVKGSSVVSEEQQKQTFASRNPALDVNLNKVDFTAPVDPSSSKNISAADKRAIYESLLAGFKTMTSKDANAMRAYMLAKASTPADKSSVNKMTDADLVSLSSRLITTMIMPESSLLLSPTAIWNRDGSTVTIQYADPNTGTTTKRVVNIDGRWY